MGPLHITNAPTDLQILKFGKNAVTSLAAHQFDTLTKLSEIDFKKYPNNHFMIKCMELGDLVITTKQKGDLFSNDQLKIKKRHKRLNWQ